MKRASIIFSAVIALGAGGLGTMALLPTSGALAGSEATSQNALERHTFAIENMTCATCPITVKKAMSNVDGVSSVEVDFETKTATVLFDPRQTTISAVASASTNAGYPARSTASRQR